jgi:hypothetical protein
MRPGSRWNGEAANPIAAAIYGVAISLLLGYTLSYLARCLGTGVVVGSGSWHGGRAFMLAGLNLYASQHIPLIGSGVPAGAVDHIDATITFPLTVWAAIPAFGLIVGGWLAGRMRADAGRWAMIVPAVAGGIAYAAVLAALAPIVSARFAFTAIPKVPNWEFNPPDIPFRPSIAGTLLYGSFFGLLFSYLGALIAVRGADSHVRGKWWACAKATIAVAIVVQLLMCAAAAGWFVAASRSGESDELAQPEVLQILPSAIGTAYALVHAARVCLEVTPTSLPSAAVQLYAGITRNDGPKTTHQRLPGYVWIGALVVALSALISGRLAVRLGSRDGSLPTAFRITVLHSAYLAAIVALCGMGWGLAGQISVRLGPRYDSGMLVEAAGVLIMSLAGAHWANRRYAGRLTGFPSV